MEETVLGLIKKIVGIVLAFFLLYYLLFSPLADAYSWRNTDSNNEAIASYQLAKLENRYLGRKRAALGASDFMKLAEDERMLINSQVYACRYAGYLGPTTHGVYSEDDAIRIACDAGYRLFVLEVAVQRDGITPYLCAYKNGSRVHNVAGSIQKVATALNKYAFMDRADPLILYIHAHDYPKYEEDPSAERLENYMAFCQRIAEELAPLEGRFLGDGPLGTYKRQGLEKQLFYMPATKFENSTIVMTNLDTTMFRTRRVSNPKKDLDYIVNCRVYPKTGKQEGAPAATVSDTAYWTDIPKADTLGAVNDARSTYSIVLLDDETTAGQATKLWTTYGIQAAAMPLYGEAPYISGPDSKFYKASWTAKTAETLYKPLPAIAIKAADPRTNANGGKITV